ncbi:ABC transporter ATP-binding protein [Kribbella sp. NPDC058693]|uniref:ABC transporter ATP-binding protein n=1 Tax=Kribbella jiaozuonensis TaxID=2575441 RepID=A0A4U3LMB6_9ACTN|nr:ABC transporter ATP-binding protein [Kribbella jiaozuonensis]TKK76289.1 ABC transporter ATP-binding protein [Kribbella jiaozuonensis]
MRLQAQGVQLAYDQHVIAKDLTLTIPDGKVSVLIGPNGSGKSTALRALARLLPPSKGSVILDGKSIQDTSTKEVARLLAILPQVLVAPESISVEDLVWFGRHPHRVSLKVPSAADKEAVEWAMAVTRTAELRHQHVDQLSGGQRQRVWIALCLAQGTDLILLDEPTTYLDVAYQLEVLDLLHQLNQEQGKTVAMVLHDFNMAAEYADHVFVMKSGKLVTEGTPEDVFTCEIIRDVFGVESKVVPHPVSGKPMCIPLRAGLRTQPQVAVVNC